MVCGCRQRRAQVFRGAGEVDAAVAEAVFEPLVLGGDRPVAGGARGLVCEVGEMAEVMNCGAEGGEREPGGFGGAREREGRAAHRGRGPSRGAGGGAMAEGALAGQESQQAGQVTDFVVQDLAQCRIRADLVGEWKVVGNGVEPVGHVVQQHPLVGIGQRQLLDAEGGFYRREVDFGEEDTIGSILLAAADAAVGGGRGAARRKLTPMPWSVSRWAASWTSRARSLEL